MTVPHSKSVLASTCIALLATAGTAHAAATPSSPPPSTWTRIANEGAAINVTNNRRVRYGLKSSWVEQRVNGAGQCTNAFFGVDPLRGVGKQCWVEPNAAPPTAPPPPSTWRRIAIEGGSFTLATAQPVRYGSGSSWVERTVSGTGACTNAFFGRDPLVGVGKECWSPVTTTPPTTPPPTTPPPGGDFHPTGYTLWFNDEFTGTQLDRTVWCTRYIYGGGAAPQVPDAQCQRNGEGTLDFLNDEQQRYVDTNRSGQIMHVVQDGVLTLRSTKTRTNDSYASYEAAMIRSKRTFVPAAGTSYYVTARVRLPNVRGTWPAFWLNSDRKPDGSVDWPPEIDIFEGALNEVEDTATMLHQQSQIRGQQTASGGTEITFSAPEFDRQWSNYRPGRVLRDVWMEVGIEWTASNVCYFVDGTRTMCENYRWVNNGGGTPGPAHVLLNLAIGGQWAGRHGVADEKFPTKLDVDYVRVYRKP